MAKAKRGRPAKKAPRKAVAALKAAPDLPRMGTASIRAWAEAFGIDRDTLGRRLTENGAKPAGVGERGHPEYSWPDLHVAAFGTNQDPDKLDPFRRKAHYQCEIDKTKLAELRGELIPREEVEQGYARIMKAVARSMDTLPDFLERDCGASGAILARVERAVDSLRVELHRALVAEDANEAPNA